MVIRPLHEPESAAKVEAIVASMRINGWAGRPILVCNEDSNEPQAFTGSHRLAAAKLTGVEPEVYSLEGKGTDIAMLMFECIDDSDRMTVVEEGGDQRAIEIMREELALDH